MLVNDICRGGRCLPLALPSSVLFITDTCLDYSSVVKLLVVRNFLGDQRDNGASSITVKVFLKAYSSNNCSLH